jgi:phosphoribosylaminoimidazole-succinocarboxamide synthase
LEAGCRQNDEIVADRCRIVREESYKHLSFDQKKRLLAFLKSHQQGLPSTSEEEAAAVEILKALESAYAAECQKAGIALADFQRYCRQTTKPTSGADPTGWRRQRRTRQR